MGGDRSSSVVAHYSHGALLAAILRGLAARGKATDRIDSDELAAGDEFHIGGREATSALFDQLDWRPGVQVLDLGCGIGDQPGIWRVTVVPASPVLTCPRSSSRSLAS